MMPENKQVVIDDMMNLEVFRTGVRHGGEGASWWDGYDALPAMEQSYYEWGRQFGALTRGKDYYDPDGVARRAAVMQMIYLLQSRQIIS